MTLAVSIAQGGSNNVSFRNRIINGAMTIDQRNAGASQTPSATATFVWTVDRFAYDGSQASKFTVGQNLGSVTPPAGFANYLGCQTAATATVGAGDYFFLAQRIEGYNASDLAWGTSNAKTVTLSFWVYSSLTGTFGGSLINNALNYSYPFSYSIPSANTWTQISVTIAGPTAGTWLGTNLNCIEVRWSLGMGSTYQGTAGSWSANNYGSATGTVNVVATSSATFYITGVQLEAGTTATPFENRLYGTELMLCQRYYEVIKYNSNGNVAISGYLTASSYNFNWLFVQEKRATPTISIVTGSYAGTTPTWYIGLDYAYGSAGSFWYCTGGTANNVALYASAEL